MIHPLLRQRVKLMFYLHDKVYEGYGPSISTTTSSPIELFKLFIKWLKK